MVVRPDIYIPILYLVAAIPYAWLGLYAWRKRPAVAVTPFAWVMLGMSVWSFGYSLEVFSPDLEDKLLFARIEYLGIISAPLFMLFFAYEYTGNYHLLTRRISRLLWFISIFILIIVWTNPFHHLMWNAETITETHGLKLLSVRFGPFFWIQVFFSYGLLLLSSSMLIMELLHRPGIYRAQIHFIILSILVPLIGNLIFIAGAGPIKNLDLTPLFFMPTALGLFRAITKYRLLEIMPPEHFSVIKNLKDGVLVLNSNQRVLYLNPTAEKLFQRKDDKVIGQPLWQISEPFYESLHPYLMGGEHQTEIKLGINGRTKIFEVTISSIPPQKPRPEQQKTDYMVVLHDVTHNKEVELALARREAIMSAISLAAEQFLRSPHWEGNISEVLGRLGQAADVSRVFVAMNYTDENKVLYSNLRYEWAAPGIAPQIHNPAMKHVALTEKGFGRWQEMMSNGRPIHDLIQELPEEERAFLEPLGSQSIAAIPIFVENRWWGFLMFDECREKRRWNSMELDSFHAAASIFGAAESRARSEQKVIRRQHDLGLLHEIVGISLQAENVKEMAQVVVERVGQLINADGCFVTLWDEAANLPVPLVSYGTQPEHYAKLKPQPGERTFTTSVLQAGHTLVVENTDSTPYADAHIVQQFPSKSVLVLPMIANQKKMGAIIIAFNKLHHFQEDEISICEQAAALLALALEKFQAVEEATRRADTSETLRKASLAIVEKLEMNQAVNHILEHLNQVVPYDSATVQMLEDKELIIIGGHGWIDLKDVLGMRFPIPGDNPNSEVIRTGKPLYLSEPWRSYKTFKHPPHDHIRSWLGVPLIVQEKIIGLLSIDSSKPDDFKEEDIRIASEFANQVAVALENARIYQEAQTQAITDALTGIHNRRGVFQIGEFEFQRARRINRPFSLLLLDIDHFKQVNDQYGHSVGDQILIQLANRCLKNSRATDLLGRYGGEEFIILLPETNSEAAKVIAERMRLSIMTTPFHTDAGPLQITSSIGIAEAHEIDSLQNLIDKADAALYKAKRTGRNRAELMEED